MKRTVEHVTNALRCSDHSFNTRGFDTLEANNQPNKQMLNELLGLKEGYREHEIRVSNRAEVINRVLELTHVKLTQSAISSRQRETVKNALNTMDNNYKVEGQRLLKWLGKKLRNYEIVEDEYKQTFDLVTKLMEVQGETHKVCISTRWQDIMLMSEYSTWDSCQSLTSSYEDLKNGTTASAIDNHTFIMWLESEEGIKTSRRLGYASQSHYILAGSTYGSSSYIVFDEALRSILKPSRVEEIDTRYDYIDWDCGYDDGVEYHAFIINEDLNRRIVVGNNGGVCWECGNIHNEGTQIYCAMCWEEQGYCEDCDDRLPVDELHEVVGLYGDVIMVCEDCFSEGYEECYVTGQWHDKRNLVYIDHADYYVHEDHLEDYIYCEDCNEWLHIDDATLCEDNDVWYCNECYDYHMKEEERKQELLKELLEA